MSPTVLLAFVIGYFLLLLGVAWYTSKNSDNESFFIGNRNSNWMLVAFGMIGTSLSGVTFVSVPGGVGKDSFAYFQIVIGYLIGYFVIAYVLLPLYYRLNLTSIYNYLSTRLGIKSYKTGAAFFILSRTLGATARLYLVVKILQDSILSSLGVPFWVTTLIILVMILIYTYEGGVKTIVFTDTLQTTFMLTGLIVCVVYILHTMGLSFGEAISSMNDKGYSKIFFTDPGNKLFFVKQILAGAFITITMTGMDQEMMQKTISVKRLKDSQKNIITLSLIMVVVIFIFLFLGGLLHLYGAQQAVTSTGDKLFPDLALNHMPSIVSIIFIIALISALFPSADGAITALTSSFCIDILGMQRREDWSEAKKKKIRQRIHLTVAAVFLLFVLVFYKVNDPSMINVILKVAAYTYGPLLGLFTFGILTKKQVHDKLVPVVCIAAPLICFVLDKFQKELLGGFQIGSELLIVNGLLTFIGLWLVSKKTVVEKI
ncbi:sodium:solute symporter [Ferruginibacter sp. HRS2-29]|uniref:sodium:solute symporter n=1 Tax=Ferruginibacter sp. HRS2-29 TaxID=2487334 RepID=UPI0020CE9A3E|nr:sodium:solute symporter [Ferruginibacter sp. HRS2-29]MCP9750259.1 sodium:solute symporter [Ferruginibacter sp. HRS2-29]